MTFTEDNSILKFEEAEELRTKREDKSLEHSSDRMATQALNLGKIVNAFNQIQEDKRNIEVLIDITKNVIQNLPVKEVKEMFVLINNTKFMKHEMTTFPSIHVLLEQANRPKYMETAKLQLWDGDDVIAIKISYSGQIVDIRQVPNIVQFRPIKEKR